MSLCSRRFCFVFFLQAFTPPDHPKTDEQKQRLKQTLSKSFMFSTLEATDRPPGVVVFSFGFPVALKGETNKKPGVWVCRPYFKNQPYTCLGIVNPKP